MEVVYLPGHPDEARLGSQLDLNWQPMTAAGALAILAGVVLGATFARAGPRSGP